MTTNDMPDIGTIFYSSWGYDQTNVDFYKVTAVGKTMATLVRVGKFRSGSEPYDDYVSPDPERELGDHFRRKVHATHAAEGRWRYSIRIASYASAWPYDGKPKRQTAMGWGH